ncbi:MAG: hypothetical protein GC161_15975 [Planctomycetaceae bacterium]|nr:hypothetical protein [Planctomycetaceae bacterium]
MLNTKTQDRVAELRAALSQAEADLADARERLGVSVADGDEAQAEAARVDAASAERLAVELRSALPVAERRAREAAQAEAHRQQKVREKAANAARQQRVAAAKKVDAALRALGRAYIEYLNTEAGGRPDDRNRLVRRSRHAIAAAAFHAAPEFAAAMDPHRRPPRMHWHPLSHAVEGTVGEFAEVEDDAE